MSRNSKRDDLRARRPATRAAAGGSGAARRGGDHRRIRGPHRTRAEAVLAGCPPTTWRRWRSRSRPSTRTSSRTAPCPRRRRATRAGPRSATARRADRDAPL